MVSTVPLWGSSLHLSPELYLTSHILAPSDRAGSELGRSPSDETHCWLSTEGPHPI